MNSNSLPITLSYVFFLKALRQPLLAPAQPAAAATSNNPGLQMKTLINKNLQINAMQRTTAETKTHKKHSINMSCFIYFNVCNFAYIASPFFFSFACSKNPMCDWAYLSNRTHLGRTVFTEGIRKHSAGTLEGFTSDDRGAYDAGSSTRRKKSWVAAKRRSSFGHKSVDFRFFVAEVGNPGLGRTLSELKDMIFQSGCNIFVW